MTVTIYLVRHAIAEDRSDSGRDVDRRLTEEGVVRMQRAVLGLARLGVAPDVVYTSPLRRARETAAILCTGLRLAHEPEVLQALAPGGARELPPSLRAGREVASIALVGHEPDLGELALLLLGAGGAPGHVAFKKGGVAAIDLHELPPRGPGALRFLLTPKLLRLLGGDEG